MPSIDTSLTRHLLVAMHMDVRLAFPDIRSPQKAASVTQTMRGMRCVEIITEGRERFVWDGRAYDAYEARYKAWAAFLQKYAPDSARQNETNLKARFGRNSSAYQVVV